jgi:hypothetical protein
MNRLLVSKVALALVLAAPPARAQSISFRHAPGSPAAVGSDPSSAAVGDFNGDGHADVAVANSRDNSVSVLIGDGSGRLRPGPGSPVVVNRNPFPTPCLLTKCGSIPLALAIADFNGDDRPDLSVTNIPINDFCSIGSVFGALCSSVAVLLGNGDGSFQPSNQFDPGGQLPTSLATGDFNADGRLDVAVTNLNSATLSVLLGDGSGKAFRQAPSSPAPVGRRPAWVSSGDLNGDAFTDLAVANADDGLVRILLGNGDGRFAAAPQSPLPLGTRPIAIAAADLDADGKADLAVADFADSVVRVLRGHADGTFGPPARFGVGAQPTSLAIADYNRDGRLDLVVANRLGNSISILQGNGAGAFVPDRNQAVGTDPQSAAAGDLNGDGATDLVVANASDNGIAVLLNTTDVVPPATLATVSPAANANGWHKAAVAVSLSATDNPGGAGVREVRYRVGNSPEVVVAGAAASVGLTTQGVFPIGYRAVDHAGNVEPAHDLAARVDWTAPTISASATPPANAASWNNSNVTVTFECADALSGIAECPASVMVSAEGANQTATGTAADLAGNAATTSRTVSLDKTPPSLTMPALAASYVLNSVVTLAYAAYDPLSGVKQVSATLNGAPAVPGETPLTRVGTNTFTLTATDIAGNVVTESATFQVLYDFDGFLPPIPNDGTGVFKLGSTVPVKFRLTDRNGVRVPGVVAHLTIQLLSNGNPIGTPIDATAPGGADSGNVFRDDGSQYIYNLATRPLSVGTWRLQASLDDGSTHTVVIGLR